MPTICIRFYLEIILTIFFAFFVVCNVMFHMQPFCFSLRAAGPSRGRVAHAAHHVTVGTDEAGPDAGQTQRVYAYVRRLGGVQAKGLALLPFR